MLKLARKFLRLNNYSNVRNEFEQLALSHPDYPSLFAIQDSLNLLIIESKIEQFSKEEIEDLPNNFITYFNGKLVLVQKNKKGVSVDSGINFRKNISYNEFLMGWDGKTLIMEPNASIAGETVRGNSKWLQICFSSLLLIGISFFYKEYNLLSIAFLTTSVIGFIFSVFLIQEKLELHNALLSKFYNSNVNKSGKSGFLIGKNSENSVVEFSDLLLTFFSSSIISILIFTGDSVLFIGLISLICLPVVLVSVCAQKNSTKRWCIWSVAMLFLIAAQSAIWIFVGELSLYLDGLSVFSFIVFSFLLISICVIVKPIVTGMIKTEKDVNDLRKFKRNYSVFDFLSEEILFPVDFNDFKGLDFGNRNADVKLVIFLNPSPDECNRAFNDAFELVLRHPDKIFLKILFNVNPDKNDPYKVFVESLLMINKSNLGKTVEAISDWYVKKMGLKKWCERWQIFSVGEWVGQEIEQQYDWCLKNHLKGVPVIIVNNKLFPNEYDIDDLKYFLNEFNELEEFIEKPLVHKEVKKIPDAILEKIA